jgi:hypothetical protein
MIYWFKRYWTIVFLMHMLLLTACSAFVSEPEVLPARPSTLTPFQPVAPTETFNPPAVRTPVPTAQAAVPATPTATITLIDIPTPEPNPDGALRIWPAPYLPAGLRQALVPPKGAVISSERENSELRLEFGAEQAVSHWVYALVAPFPTIPEQIELDDLRRVWFGEATGSFASRPLFMDAATQEVFTYLWGAPDPVYLRILTESELLETAWRERPSWALIPFESLVPRWKVLEVEGQSPVRKEFDISSYPLVAPFSLHSDVLGSEYLSEAGQALGLPTTNRKPDRLTTLAMTGVTAMVRCTAFTMEQRGYTYPAADIGNLLREADLTHISNEIPFAPGCPYPSCMQEGLVFCSSPGYIELMEYVGTNIVELTGDHFADWGTEAMYYTLEMYREQGWPYYGGGENRDDAMRPLLIEHNGNRLAFIGCNAKSLVGYATASDTNPGAVRCDWNYLHAEISRLRAEGYIPIATFQHEEYYRYTAAPNMQEDFRGVAEAGALIVSGSQAHQPHGMEFVNDAFLHYGLGNLFFDQFGYCIGDACSQAFIDRHIFYDNRYISTELIPIQFVNYARTRFMSDDEKSRFYEIIFNASNWD